MSRVKLPSLLFGTLVIGLLGVTTIPYTPAAAQESSPQQGAEVTALDDFPGQAPGVAKAQVSGPAGAEDITMSNDVLALNWHVGADGPRVTSARNLLTHAASPITGTGFIDLALADGSAISGADLSNASAVTVKALAGDPDAARVADRSPGQSASATYRLAARGYVVDVLWSLILRDGSNSVQQRVEVRAVEGTLPIRTVSLFKAEAAQARVVGKDDGNPLVFGSQGQESFFAGVENPMSQAQISGSQVAITLPQASDLAQGASQTHTWAIGAVAPGQLRRSFLYYLERERIHARHTFLHYQSWFDLKPPGEVIKADELSTAIDLFGTEMTERGATLDSYWIDDGWDYLRAPSVSPEPDVWSFDPTQFANGFAEQKQIAASHGGSLSLWMSPFGGYGTSASSRLAINAAKPPAEQYELTGGRFKLSDPDYYDRFKQVAFEMIDNQGVRGFKFDGIGGGLHQTGPNRTYLADYEALLRLSHELRERQPDIWINATVGTWGSPYWLWYVDSIWRDGHDAGQTGPGSAQQRYVTFRDAETYVNVAAENPLFPITALMNHGVIFSDRAPQFSANHDLTNPTTRDEVSEDIRAYFALGLGLQELYVRNTLVRPEVLGADWFWDTLATNAKWARANEGLLTDSHWVGGDPALEQIYGTAAWQSDGGGQGMLMLRNPSSSPKSITLDGGAVLELPAGAARRWEFTERDGLRPTFVAEAGTPRRVTLEPFEVAVFIAGPTDAAPTPDDPGPATPLDRTGWSASTDSEEISGENGRAGNVLDGSNSTLWHTAYSSGVAPLPHQITLDLGREQTFATLAYTPRQDGGTNGIISSYEIRTSSDGTTWSDPVAAGAFDGTTQTQRVTFPSVSARYVRLIATGSANGQGYSSAAEINLYAPATSGVSGN